MSQHKGEGGIRVAVDPNSTVCERVGQIIEQAKGQGKISGQDRGFIIAHLEECGTCRESWRDELPKLKLDIPS